MQFTFCPLTLNTSSPESKYIAGPGRPCLPRWPLDPGSPRSPLSPLSASKNKNVTSMKRTIQRESYNTRFSHADGFYVNKSRLIQKLSVFCTEWSSQLALSFQNVFEQQTLRSFIGIIK